ncbi:MAG: hypothetical protein ACLUNZ_00015 [Evtepia sp.]
MQLPKNFSFSAPYATIKRHPPERRPRPCPNQPSPCTPSQNFTASAPPRAAALAKLGLHTTADLLAYFPRDYEDRTLRESIAVLPPTPPPPSPPSSPSLSAPATSAPAWRSPRAAPWTTPASSS